MVPTFIRTLHLGTATVSRRRLHSSTNTTARALEHHSGMTGVVEPCKTVVVLGVAYGGAHACKTLAQKLPAGWRVVGIDRNSHMNHVYVFPRYIALPKHAPKAFVPVDNLFKPPVALEENEVSKANDAAKSNGDGGSESSTNGSAANGDAGANGAASTSKANGSPDTHSDASSRGYADHEFIQGQVTSLSSHSVTINLPDSSGHYTSAGKTRTVQFDYCVYALGASLPAPCDVWGEVHGEAGRGSKRGSVQWMEAQGAVMRKAERILVIGAGALGIQFATDLKDLYPSKEVTLLHSRTRLLPRYPQEMHDAVIAGLDRAGVKTVLGERVVSWPASPGILDGEEKTVRTDKGNLFSADIVLACTGQKPHTALMAGLEPRTINPATGRICVRPTTQVARVKKAEGEVAGGMARMSLQTPALTPVGSDDEEVDPMGWAGRELAGDADLDHIFAIGDCADTTAIQAGHVAYYQAEVAVKNIVKLVEQQEARERGETIKREALDLYTPTPPMIKVTLGLKHHATSMPTGVTTGDDGVEDIQARLMWTMYAAEDLPDDA